MRGCSKVLEDCPGQKCRRPQQTLCVRGCSNVLEDCPWLRTSTSTVDFVCEKVLKCVRRLAWLRTLTSTVSFYVRGAPSPKMWTSMFQFSLLFIGVRRCSSVFPGQ